MTAVMMEILNQHHVTVGSYVEDLVNSGGFQTDSDGFTSLKAFLTGLQAKFPGTADPSYDPGTKTWRLDGVMVVHNVEEHCQIERVGFDPSKLQLHLPNAEIFGASRALAAQKDAEDNSDTTYPPQFYQKFFGSKAKDPTHSEFLRGRVADYMFVTCR